MRGPESGWIVRFGEAKVKEEIILVHQRKKKLQHPVPFFTPEKMAVSRPALPRIPPQTHHKNTTSYTRFSQKTPAKTALHHSK
jgi:hypothetical protein